MTKIVVVGVWGNLLEGDNGEVWHWQGASWWLRIMQLAQWRRSLRGSTAIHNCPPTHWGWGFLGEIQWSQSCTDHQCGGTMHPNTYISAVTTFYGADKRDNCFAWATSVLSYLVSAISCCKTWMTRWLLAHKNRRTGCKQPRHEYGWEDRIMATQLITENGFMRRHTAARYTATI